MAKLTPGHFPKQPSSFHDLVFLLATGACLGVGLSALVRYFVFRRKG
jgi:hypothetical protein